MSNNPRVITIHSTQEWRLDTYLSFESEASYSIRKYVSNRPTAELVYVGKGEKCKKQALQLADAENQKLKASGEHLLTYNINLDNVY